MGKIVELTARRDWQVLRRARIAVGVLQSHFHPSKNKNGGKLKFTYM